MRVTQSMLSNTMLRNLNTSYSKMGQWQEQLSSGSKLLRPSDDPVGTTKAMSYRTQLTQNEQYTSNLDTATKWLDSSDDALGQLTNALSRVRELVTQAANDPVSTDRDKILLEIQQIHEEAHDIANTKVGDTYIFSGTRVNEPRYKDGAMQNLPGMDQDVNIEVYNQITLNVNTTGSQRLFTQVDSVLNKVEEALKNPNASAQEISDLLGGTNSPEDRSYNTLQGILDLSVMERSEVGAKQNRVDMMADRLSLQKETLTKQQSNVEDVEYEKTITNMITQESIHNAALSVGSKIIQQTLVDFIR